MAEEYLYCSTNQLNLDVILNNGQAFRWRKEPGDYWIGIVHHRLWKIWRVDDTKIAFQILHNFQPKEKQTSKDGQEILRRYFQLDVDLEQLYQQWASKCTYFKKLLAENRATFEGIRILEQDPVEALFAFICSANNNISRITKMIEKLCELYGTSVQLSTCNENGSPQLFHDFPTIPQLAANLEGMEATLRAAAFGYRASSIAKCIHLLTNKGRVAEFGDAENWLNSLRLVPYEMARERLLELPGVGPKVADCICLMALGKHSVVPVDTHIFNLTAEIYKPKFMAGRKVALSKAMHSQIGEFYKDLFGDYAGWIQSILFSTRLKRFKKA